MNIPENTAGRREARKALEETRKSRRNTADLIARANRQIAEMVYAREENHFVDGIKRMLRGTA